MVRTWFLGLATFVLQTGCAEFEHQMVGKEQAIQIAQKYVKSHYPQTNPRSRPSAHDQGQTWLVRYELPPGWFGGGPVITIDKKTGKVIAAYAEQ